MGFDDSPFVVVYLESMSRLRGVVDAQIDRLDRAAKPIFFRPCSKLNASSSGSTSRASTSSC